MPFAPSFCLKCSQLHTERLSPCVRLLILLTQRNWFWFSTLVWYGGVRSEITHRRFNTLQWSKNMVYREVMVSGILLRVVYVVLCMSCVIFSVAAADVNSEVGVLMEFKARLNDPLNALSDWTEGASWPCKWTGIRCTSEVRGSVIAINLPGKNFSGTLPPFMAGLKSLQVLDLSCNNLSGPIPVEILNCSGLRRLNLSSNNFSGEIPYGLSGLRGLEVLDLYDNTISGSIPSDIGRFPSIRYLDLGGNCLEGRIPSDISNLSTLTYLTLAGNELRGDIPPGLSKLRRLEWIYLGYNHLTGGIPSEMGEMTSLNHLDIVYNNITGNIPAALGNLTELEYLFLYQNKLSGSIPMSIYNLTNLISLDLSDNSLTGEVPEAVGKLQKLQILNLFSNNLTGRIPRSLAFLPRLEVLALWANRLTGDIPVDLGMRNNLSALDLSGNFLHGSVPSGLCKSKRLYKLILFSNVLTGPIPKSLANCRSLQRVRLENNLLSGDLPVGFTQLPLVYYLDVSSNDLSGPIDRIPWRMPSLQMLHLQQNRLTGRLPNSIGKLAKLEVIDLSSNRFVGEIPRGVGNLDELTSLHLRGNLLSGRIPEEISNCRKLVTLDVSNNRLVGPIPGNLAGMPVLGTLDLSENQLTGVIPAELGSVESLVFVNVSHNHLAGPLPLTGAFVEINYTAVAGNDGLCGASPGLNRCPLNSSRWRLCVAISVGAFVIFCGAFMYWAVRLRRSRQLKKVESAPEVALPDWDITAQWELLLFHKIHFSIDDARNARREENIIDKGSTGTLYRAYTQKGRILAVKELCEYSPTLSSQIQFLGKLQHPNIVKLLGSCTNDATGLLVYEYLEKGSLHGLLHGTHGSCTELTWRRRLKIASGTAKALAYMHHGCSPSILHGSVTSSKVILDANYGAHLVLNISNSYAGSSASKASKGFLCSGYVAPEYVAGKELSEKTDVYSFGVLMVELLSGRRPVEPEFGEHANIVEWAHARYGEWDCSLLIDPALSECMAAYQSEIMRCMNLAIRCTAVSPAVRPTMREVVHSLKTVRKSAIGLRFS